MKKFLLTALLLFVVCMPVFCAESVFVPNITTEQAKKALVTYLTANGWLLKGETNYSIDFYQTKMVHSPELYEKEKLIHDQFRQSQIKNAQNGEKEIDYRLERERNKRYSNNQPPYYNKEEVINLQFILKENDGVTITTYSSSAEIKETLKVLFTGYYSYNIQYKFPLLKKDYILLSDTDQTHFDKPYKLGKNRKVVKINDKMLSEYKKSDLKKMFNDCKKEQIKLETDDNLGQTTFILLRTFNEPAYKQYQ